MNKIEVLEIVNELLYDLAKPHTPEDTTVQAIIDQWLHAIATNSQFFCHKVLISPVDLKDQVLSILSNESIFINTKQFYQFVFADLALKPLVSPKFRFIDLFAGIGGVRLGFQAHGGACVFSSEFDKSAQNTYKANHGELPFGDITKISERDIPEHDILLAGFPCQPFSHAGVSARNSIGKSHGFLCDVQGTLFFDVLRVIEEKQPKVVFLENVRNIERHDKGNTFQIIKESILKLGYSFDYKIIDSSSIVPQRRVRCYMVCFRNDLVSHFDFPEILGDPLPLKSILEESVDDIYTISDRLWNGHIERTKRNISRGVGFSAHLADLNKPSNTIVARYGKDGKECLIPQDEKNPRMLTPRECARLQGFPEEFCLPKARTPAYKQFGNSVVVPLISKIAEKITKEII